MAIDPAILPEAPSLLHVRKRTGETALALWHDGRVGDLSTAHDERLRNLDQLLELPLAEIRLILDGLARHTLAEIPVDAELLAPVQSQEVWAAGVTYRRSREARMEEAKSADIYALVYEAERPEIFFKATGWRVVGPGGAVGVRSDSSWDVPEPELAVLTNAWGEVIAYSCGNDMSSRSIEGENPLYLPQAKVYDRSCSIGPAAVLAWHVEERRPGMRLVIRRDGQVVFQGEASVGDMVREPEELAKFMHGCYSLPVGAWLLTGTSIVPPLPYTCQAGDEIGIAIDGLGELRNRVELVRHHGAQALPRVHEE